MTEIRVAANASLTHVRLQDESTSAFSMATIYADIAADAIYDSFTLTTGSRLARTEIHVRLAGANGHAAINTAQLLRGNSMPTSPLSSRTTPHPAPRDRQ